LFLPLITKRRSIRRFKTHRVEREKIDSILEAALRAPSSRGFNPWQFVVVTEPALLKKLSGAKEHGSAFLKGAPLGIVVCADPGISDVWVEDTSIATIFIQLAAESIGLSSCWIQVRKRKHQEGVSAEDFVRTTLGIPGKLCVASMVAIGYPDEEKPPHKKESLPWDKVHVNTFGNLLY
jgi:nitroreductase